MKVDEIKKTCNKLGIYPSKKLGQNFLINQNIVEKIILASGLKKNDNVLEIGSGLGVLTQELIKKVDNLIVVEKDKKLAEYLTTNNKQLTTNNKIEIINDDILKIKNSDLFKNLKIKNYKLISNLPYQITSPILWKFLQEEKKLNMMVLMVQKEVAERIISKPGKMSILAVLCQFYAEIEKVCDVSRENFWPIPDVDSAVIKLKLHANNDTNKYEYHANDFDTQKFFQIVKIGFSQKRKMLKNNLSNGLQIPQENIIKILKEVGLNQKIRAQELSVENWVKICKKI